MFLKLINHIEKRINNSRNNYSIKMNNYFLNEFNLMDEKSSSFTVCKYNGYQATPIILCETLVKSGVINRNDKILDIGCGCGIFICYLLSKDFIFVNGIEVDEKLYNIANSNIQKVLNVKKTSAHANIYLDNFFNFKNIDDYNVFYIFNSFNSEDLYVRFLETIKNSVERKNRHIKIIFLYLTLYSKKALLQSDWLKRTNVITDKRQMCYQCINYVVYENK